MPDLRDAVPMTDDGIVPVPTDWLRRGGLFDPDAVAADHDEEPPPDVAVADYPVSPVSPVVPVAAPAWPTPPEEAAFYGVAGEYVRAIELQTEADPVAILAQVLLLAGNVIGRTAHFRVENDYHYTNLNVMLVGATAVGRKGTALGRAKAPFALLDEEWLTKCRTSGLSSGEGLVHALRDPIIKREPIKKGGIVRDYQDVVIDEGVSDKRLYVTQTEFASILKVLERDGNTLSGVLRQAWDGEPQLRTLTRGAPETATNAHISVIGQITLNELQRGLKETEMANGFANRFPFFCVKRARELPNGGQPVPIEDFVDRFAAALMFAKENAREFKRDADADAKWRQEYHRLSEGRPGLLGSVTARAEAQTMRFALVYAILDCSPVIGLPHLTAALALWDYAFRSAQYIFGNSLGDPVADKILSELRAGPLGMTRTEIGELFSWNRHKADIDRALGSLAGLGLVTSETVATGDRGRPAERWRAT